MEHGRSDPSGRLHLVKDPQQAVNRTVVRLGLGPQELVAGDECVILAPRTTQRKAVRQGQARTLPAQLLREVHFVGIKGYDAEAELTQLRGKEWSSYNGAVRLFWPGVRAGDNPMRHPLWMRWTLLSGGKSAADAAARFTVQMRRQLLGLSAFSVPEPSSFAATRTLRAKQETEAARASLRSTEDWEGLANVYAEHNDKLLAATALNVERIRELEEEVAGLKQALQWRPQVEHEGIAPERDVPPQTVGEAVRLARERLSDALVFGADVDTGVGTLAQDAGPPEKILSYLETLAEMARTRRTSGLGMQMLEWLQARNVTATGESQTIRNSDAAIRRRTWDADGERRPFEAHLKPSDGVHPDRCARIYFVYDDARNKAIVGWVGRHPT